MAEERSLLSSRGSRVGDFGSRMSDIKSGPKITRSSGSILKKYKNFSFFKIKIENEKKLSEYVFSFKPEIIIHLAAQAGVRYSIQNPETYLNSNILGTFNILKIANKING